jgi:hypothetical protein
MRDEKSKLNGFIEAAKGKCKNLNKNQRWLLLIPIVIPFTLNPLALLGLICFGLFIWLQINYPKGK